MVIIFFGSGCFSFYEATVISSVSLVSSSTPYSSAESLKTLQLLLHVLL